MIDETLGMAYGISCRTFLKTSVNVPSCVIFVIVYYAKIPTYFILMLAYIEYKNIVNLVEFL